MTGNVFDRQQKTYLQTLILCFLFACSDSTACFPMLESHFVSMTYYDRVSKLDAVIEAHHQQDKTASTAAATTVNGEHLLFFSQMFPVLLASSNPDGPFPQPFCVIACNVRPIRRGNAANAGVRSGLMLRPIRSRPRLS